MNVFVAIPFQWVNGKKQFHSDRGRTFSKRAFAEERISEWITQDWDVDGGEVFPIEITLGGIS